MNKRTDTKSRVDELFERMVGCRFFDYEKMETWFKNKLNDDYPQLSICECDGINSEIKSGITDVDYSTDCTFGENLFGFDCADFTIDYIKDNAEQMYVTYVRWN